MSRQISTVLNRGTSKSGDSDQGVDDRCGADLGPAACQLCCLKEREPGGAMDRSTGAMLELKSFSVGYGINM